LTPPFLCHVPPPQIWAIPNESRLKPSYTTRHFPRSERLNTLVPVVAPTGSSSAVSAEREAEGPAPVHADLHLFATVLEPGKEVGHKFKPALKGGKPRRAYVHVVRRSLCLRLLSRCVPTLTHLPS
jgi:hypothetical protein